MFRVIVSRVTNKVTCFDISDGARDFKNILNMARVLYRSFCIVRYRGVIIMIPIILIYLLRFCECQSYGVKYVVNMDSQMECCDEESQSAVDTSGVTVGRYNETIAYMNGDINFKNAVGPNTMVEILLQKEASGKYELMFSHEICDLCAEVAKGPDSDYYSYMKYFGIPDECPFEAGDYSIKELIVDTDDLPVNSNTVGRYQAFLTIYDNPDKDCKANKEFLFCLTLKLLVEMD